MHTDSFSQISRWFLWKNYLWHLKQWAFWVSIRVDRLLNCYQMTSNYKAKEGLFFSISEFLNNKKKFVKKIKLNGYTNWKSFTKKSKIGKKIHVWLIFFSHGENTVLEKRSSKMYFGFFFFFSKNQKLKKLSPMASIFTANTNFAKMVLHISDFPYLRIFPFIILKTKFEASPKEFLASKCDVGNCIFSK